MIVIVQKVKWSNGYARMLLSGSTGKNVRLQHACKIFLRLSMECGQVRQNRRGLIISLNCPKAGQSSHSKEHKKAVRVYSSGIQHTSRRTR